MPNFSNVHAELDNNEIHPPRDFSLAEPDTFLSKNPLGDIQWYDTYWQRPVLGFADSSMPPLTLRHGDRYILSGSTSIDNTSIDVSVDTSVDSSIWLDSSFDGEIITPAVPEPSTVHPAWGNVSRGDVVEYFRNDNKNNLVFEWRAVTPKQGYQIFNLADRRQYYFNGSTWGKLTTDNASAATAQLAATYAELQTLVTDRGLMPGIRYRIIDRDIILTAVSSTEFSVEGDYTLLFPARASLSISHGRGGSISSVMVNGVELLPSTVETEVTPMETASVLAETINQAEASHGFSAISIMEKVYIGASNKGAVLNGQNVTVSATGVTIAATNFSDGYDTGELWFKVKYDFANDWINEMRDVRGNVVSASKAIVAHFELNPYLVFPWQYDTVTDNQIQDAILIAFPHAAMVVGNRMSDKSALLINIDDGSSFSYNTIQLQTLGRLGLQGCQFANNSILVSLMDLQIAGGAFIGNTISKGTILGNDVALDMFGGNMVINTILQAQHALVENISTCNFLNCELNVNDGQNVRIKNCTMSNAEFDGQNGHFSLSDNDVANSVLNVSKCMGGFSVERNHIGQFSNVQLPFAQGAFRENSITNSDLLADHCNTDFSRNSLTGYSEVYLTHFSGTGFYENQISRGNHTFSNSTTQVTYNHIEGGITALTNHHGTCTNNRFRYADVYSDNCESRIENNFLEYSNLNLNRSNALFSSNNGTYYSVYDLDDYLGNEFILSNLEGSSSIIASGNRLDQARITVKNLTRVKILAEYGGYYLSHFDIGDAEIELSQTQQIKYCSRHYSTLEYDVEVSAEGILDLNSPTTRFGGKYNISNDSLISVINGSFLPEEFILMPKPGITISIDTTGPNLSVINNLNVGELNGSESHYVKISKKSGKMYIVEAFTS